MYMSMWLMGQCGNVCIGTGAVPVEVVVIHNTYIICMVLLWFSGVQSASGHLLLWHSHLRNADIAHSL